MTHQNHGNEETDIETASKERHLAEQAIFRNVLTNVRKKHRRVLFWTVVSLLFVALFFAVFGCPLLHWSGICPLFKSSMR